MPTLGLTLPLCTQIDADGSGTIDFDEFLSLMTKQSEKVDPRKVCVATWDGSGDER